MFFAFVSPFDGGCPLRLCPTLPRLTPIGPSDDRWLQTWEEALEASNNEGRSLIEWRVLSTVEVLPNTPLRFQFWFGVVDRLSRL